MSRLIVALSVVGCLYAVQAKPHIGKLGGEIERETLESLPTEQLLNRTYDKLSTLLDTFLLFETEVLHECLSQFVIFNHKHLFDNGFDVNYERTIKKLRLEVDEMTLEQVVEFARELHIEVSDRLSQTEIEKTRGILTKFLNDPTPDIKYYIQHSWCTLYDDYTAVESTDYYDIMV